MRGDRAEPGATEPIGDLLPRLRVGGVRAVSPNGVLGDPVGAPAEAGDHGARAEVGRLVITHISDELDELWARGEAERAFGGPVHVAHEGDVFEL